MPCASQTQDQSAENVAGAGGGQTRGALELTMARASGAAMTVSALFNTMTAPPARGGRARLSFRHAPEYPGELAVMRGHDAGSATARVKLGRYSRQRR